ncbi:hypothetical protein J5TS1_34340 [Bacillus licheniformis]|nr:hypothetical protein J2TS5_08430 [Bacillus licheniformis]GIN35931.1 hypothetical protein J5TS1_34340 [Bacillus licheniformis]
MTVCHIHNGSCFLNLDSGIIGTSDDGRVLRLGGLQFEKKYRKY